MIIDFFVPPSIYWPEVYKVPMMAVIVGGYLLFLGWATGPFDSAPRWARWVRLGAELTLLLSLTTTCLPLFDQMTKIGDRPLADAWLARADELIGFNWLAYFEFVHDRPSLMRLMDIAYHRQGDLVMLMILSLIVLGKLRRVAFHMEAVVWTTLVAILFSAFTPAFAAAIYYRIDFAEYPNFELLPGLYHVESLIQLREASPDYRVGEQSFKGLVTFPSIHTALGVLMMGAVWRHWLFWPVCGYVAIMVASTPVFGSHYLIDVIAGLLLALAVMWLVSRRDVYRGLFIPGRARCAPANYADA